MPKICAFSNRIYKATLSKSVLFEINSTIDISNDMKHKAYALIYNTKYKAQKHDKSIQLLLKDEFSTSDYYVNSARKEAESVLSSQEEKLKLDISNLENEIKTRNKKIKDTEKALDNKLKIKSSLIKISKVIKENKILELEYNKFKLENPNSKKKLKLKKLPKFKTYKGAREYLIDEESLIFGVRRRKKDDLVFDNMYTFEVCYLNNQIKKLNNRLKQLKFGLNRAENKLNKLQNNLPKQVCFGGSKLFKKQFTTDIKHSDWKDSFYKARHKKVTISGRKDANQGNFVFRYNNKKLTFTSINGVKVEIDNLYFPYGQDKVVTALNLTKSKRKAVAWSIEDRGEYYIFKCIIELPKNENLNYPKDDGIISYDVNYDHIAWVNLNKQGSIVDKGIIRYDLYGKTANQATNIIEEVAKELCDIAVSYKKPLGGEDLNTEESKSKLMYGNSKRNRKLSQFAYQKIMSAIDSRAYKCNLYVYKRNPAYTSQIGKLKYMKPLGLSIHTSAAYVIGRRCLGFKEKVPKIYKKFLSKEQKARHHWSQWSYISKSLKQVETDKFYKTINAKNVNKITELKELLAL